MRVILILFLILVTCFNLSKQKPKIDVFDHYEIKYGPIKEYFFIYKQKIEVLDLNKRKILTATRLKKTESSIKEKNLIIIAPTYGSGDPSYLLSYLILIWLEKTDIIILDKDRPFFWDNPKAIKNLDDLKKKLKEMQINSLKRLLAINKLIQALKKRYSYSKIGILGLSYGAIESSIFISQNNNFDFAVLILGGADIINILMETQEKSIRSKIDLIRKNLNLEKKDFKIILEKYLRPLDPLNYQSKLSPNSILMINGIDDLVIPIKNAELLWNHLGKPQWIKVRGGHVGISLFFPYLYWKMINFIEKKLNPD